MRKLVSVFLLFFVNVSVAEAAQDYLIGDNRMVYEEKTGWYMTFRADMNFMNWTNTYNSNWVGYSGQDKYSMESLLGGGLTVGKSFSYFWRGEVEAGYTGTFVDEDAGIEFNFSSPYVLANALYDFKNNLYIGASLGAAFPKTTWDWDAFLPGTREKTSISPMAGLIFGISKRLDYRFVLDLRYRLAGLYGSKHTRYFEDTATPANRYYFESDMGLVLDNQFSVGLRYEF